MNTKDNGAVTVHYIFTGKGESLFVNGKSVEGN